MTDENPHQSSAREPTAGIELRVAAGVLDFITLSGLAFLLAYGPAMLTGMALPMVGAVAAIVVYNVLPITQLGGTLWMKIMGLEVRSDGEQRADPSLVLFRELIGRGLLGIAFVGTGFVSVIGYVTGSMHTATPTGFDLLLGISTLLLLGIAFLSHLMVLFNKDHRGLHDLMAKTTVVRANKREAADEEEAEFNQSRKRRAVKMLVVSQLLIAGLAVAVPYLMGSAKPRLDLRDKVALKQAKEAFDAEPWNEQRASAYLRKLRETGRSETYEEVEKQHAAVLAERAKNPEEHDLKTQGHKRRLAADPCNKRLVLKLADRLNKIRAYEVALKEVASFEEACGPWNRLMWVAEYSNRQLGRHQDAVTATTRLIEADPHDSDYWWWRARNYGLLKKLDHASSDYRHSMAVNPNKYGASYMATLLADTDPCEGAYALRHYFRHRADAGDWVTKRAADLELKGSCKHPKGTISIRAKKNETEIKTKAGINGTTGNFLVYNSAYLTVTDAFAEKAGLSQGTKDVPIYAAGEFPLASITTADVMVGKVTAKDVPIAIVATLPGDLDGLLGLSFTWRFKSERTDKALVLSGR